MSFCQQNILTKSVSHHHTFRPDLNVFTLSWSLQLQQKFPFLSSSQPLRRICGPTALDFTSFLRVGSEREWQAISTNRRSGMHLLEDSTFLSFSLFFLDLVQLLFDTLSAPKHTDEEGRRTLQLNLTFWCSKLSQETLHLNWYRDLGAKLIIQPLYPFPFWLHTYR